MHISSDMLDWLTLQSAEENKIAKKEDWEKTKILDFLD